MAGSRVGRDRWRQVCGWLALAAAALWALKFTFIVATPEYAPGDQIPPTLELLDRWYVQFVAPALGSLLGLVALSGLAEPLVRGRRWFIGLPIALVVSLLGTMALSGLVNTLATRAIDSSSIAADVEPGVLVSAAALLLVSAVLLRPTSRGWALGAVLALGGGVWITPAILVASGATLEGWLVVAYQVGLYLLVAGATRLVADAQRSGRYRAGVLSVLGVIATFTVAGWPPVLSGGFGWAMVGGLGVAEALRRLVQARRPDRCGQRVRSRRSGASGAALQRRYAALWGTSSRCARGPRSACGCGIECPAVA